MPASDEQIDRLIAENPLATLISSGVGGLEAPGRLTHSATLPAPIRKFEYSGNVAPTGKPVSVLQPLICSFSRPGDIVLDPFSGSGSTLVAAALSGRRCMGIDLEAKDVELARRRLAGVDRAKSRRTA